MSHIRKTGRLDLKVQVSVSIPWVWEDREGLGRETQGYVSRKVDPGVLLAGVGQRPTECQSWAVGAASGMGALYLKLYGPPVSLVCKFPEATEASATAEQRKKELLSRQHTGKAFGPHCWAARMGSLRKCQVWRPPWTWTLTVGLWKMTSEGRTGFQASHTSARIHLRKLSNLA